MTKQNALNLIVNVFPHELPEDIMEVVIECMKESITAEELKNDLLNEFEGVPI